MPRIGIARLWFEGNSFSPVRTTIDAFRSREWNCGPEALEIYRGTATELGAVLDFVEDRTEWEAEVFRCASAQPGGPMTDAAFAEWLDEVEEGVREADIDGLYLSLHGACLTESDPEADLTVLRRLRGALGADRPMAASFDFHANLSPQTVGLLDGASAYRTYPHVDMDAAARRALRLLERALRRRPAQGSIVKLPFVLHSFHMRHEAGPMAEIWALAREAERNGALDVSPFGGFAWGDTAWAGPSIMVWAEEHEAARSIARGLARELAERRPRFAVSLPTSAEGLREALAAPPGLVALLDPADNPLSGGIADTPGLLRSLVEAGPPVETVFSFLHDPATVAAARIAGVGSRLERPLGARVTRDFGEAVPFHGTVERITSGRFLNEGPMEHGAPVDLGTTCVLRQGALRVIVTSRKEAAVDPAFFALHGIDLAAVRLLANKAKNHFRAAFAGRCVAIVECDTPGPAALDLAALPFHHVPPAYFA
jgi:microcystin degradation protein MlrC